MTIKVAVNGHANINHNILCVHDEGGRRHDLPIVAVDGLNDAKIDAGSTQHDSVHGRFSDIVVADGQHEDIRCARHPRVPRSRRCQPHVGFEHLRHVARQGVGARQGEGLVRERRGLHAPHVRHQRRVAEGQAKRASK